MLLESKANKPRRWTEQEVMRFLIRAVAKNQTTTIALKGDLERLPDLEHFLAKHTMRAQRMTNAALA